MRRLPAGLCAFLSPLSLPLSLCQPRSAFVAVTVSTNSVLRSSAPTVTVPAASTAPTAQHHPLPHKPHCGFNATVRPVIASWVHCVCLIASCVITPSSSSSHAPARVMAIISSQHRSASRAVCVPSLRRPLSSAGTAVLTCVSVDIGRTAVSEASRRYEAASQSQPVDWSKFDSIVDRRPRGPFTQQHNCQSGERMS